jgi:hypothetical protein
MNAEVHKQMTRVPEDRQRASVSFLKEAQRYAALGLSIIPIRNEVKTGRKRPPCPWEQFQTSRPTASELTTLFSQRGLTGLAVVLGSVSNDLYARDFDDVQAYEAWGKEHPELAGVVPTVQTARGFHLYARFAHVTFKEFPDGELRGEGHYTVLPPSIHPTGRPYVWIIGGPAAVFEANPEAIGLSRTWGEADGTEKAEKAEEAERSERAEKSEESEVVGGASPALPRLVTQCASRFPT